MNTWPAPPDGTRHVPFFPGTDLPDWCLGPVPLHRAREGHFGLQIPKPLLMKHPESIPPCLPCATTHAAAEPAPQHHTPPRLARRAELRGLCAGQAGSRAPMQLGGGGCEAPCGVPQPQKGLEQPGAGPQSAPEHQGGASRGKGMATPQQRDTGTGGVRLGVWA